MTKITFMGGIDEIGGNCFLVEDGSSRVLLDFGTRYAIRGQYFEEYLKPRTAAGLVDSLTMGLIPPRFELYRGDLLRMMGKEPPADPYLDGFLLTHIHYDHSSNIAFLDERVPIHLSEATRLYAKSLIESGRRNIETEVYNYKPRPLAYPKIPPLPRVFEPFEQEATFNVGSITVHSFPVDHSVAGASAFLLECSDCRIAYTGDLRLHGPAGIQTQRSVEKLGEYEPDLLLCEGTRIDSNATESEASVKKDTLGVAKPCDQLIVGDFAPRDVWRLSTFHQIAKELGRKLLITKQDAYLIRELGTAPSLRNTLPPIDDPSILVYVERKDTGSYKPSDYDTWEREFITLPNAVRADHVHEHQGEIIACMSFFDINELIDMRPNPGSIYVESTSEPHSEEQVIDVKRLDSWLDFFHLGKYHFHASGHANASDLQAVIQTINSKRLIPIHTVFPDIFKTMHGNVTRVKLNDTVNIK